MHQRLSPHPPTKALVYLETENSVYLLPQRKNGMKTAQVNTKQQITCFYYKFPLYSKCNEKRNTPNIPFLETIILEDKGTITANEVTIFATFGQFFPKVLYQWRS